MRNYECRMTSEEYAGIVRLIDSSFCIHHSFPCAPVFVLPPTRLPHLEFVTMRRTLLAICSLSALSLRAPLLPWLTSRPRWCPCRVKGAGSTGRSRSIARAKQGKST